MARTTMKVSTTARVVFTVYDSNDAAVTGLGNGDFTKLLSKDGSNDATAVTVAEIANGRYTATFTPASTGVWYVLITQATYNLRGWEETFDVTTDGIPTVSAIQSGLATSSALSAAQSDVTAIKAKTDNLPASPAAVGSAMTLTVAYDAAKTAAQAGDEMTLTAGEEAALVAAVWAAALETGFSASRLLRIIAAAAAGKTSDGVTFRNLGDTLNQIAGTATAAGIRSAATYGS